MAKNQDNRLRINYAIVAICLLAGWGIIKAFEYQLNQYANAYSLKRATSDSSYESRVVIGPVVEDRNSYDYLLIESILSIIQNYYVDAERVGNHELFILALQRLEEKGEINFRIADQEIEIEKNKRILRLQYAPDFDLPTLVSYVASVSELLLDPKIDTVVTSADADNWLHEGRFKFLDAMLNGLDPHSALLDSFAYRELRQGTEGSFGGLGVVVGVKKDLLTVIKPIPKSPAARAGIQKNDKIIKINNTSTFGATLDSLVEHMRGAPGTRVNLSLMREGAFSPSELSIKREIIQVDSVIATPVAYQGQSILHLAIESFSARTAKEVQEAIEKQRAGGEFAGVILDLRGNPGGLLDQAVRVSDLFLRSGDIVSTKGRRLEIEGSHDDAADYDFPVVVLINSDSASASEIVAGALKDNHRALVIGQPSFGKGSVQTIFELPGEQALKLTIARYYTPSGISIQNKGIQPDIWVQPVLDIDRNENLLGAFRYRNERFLKNSLARHNDKAPERPDHMSYYLTDKIVDSPDESSLSEDYEVNLALGVIASKVRQDSPYSQQTDDNLVTVLDNQTQDTDDALVVHLNKKFGIDWSAAAKRVDTQGLLHAELNIPETVEVGVDNELQLSWSLENKSQKDAERVSVFLLVGSDAPASYEYLVGKVSAESTVEYNNNLPLVLSKGQKRMVLRYGVSIDGVPTYFNKEFITVGVVDGPVPEIVASAELVQEAGGRIPGVIEANEQGYLKVRVENKGHRMAENLALNLVSLSGLQVSLENSQAELKALRVGEFRDLLFPVVAASQINSADLGFGLTIKGSNMLRALKKRVDVRAMVTANSNTKDVLGH